MKQVPFIFITLFVMQCTAQPCNRPHEFLCSNNECIYSGFQCDGDDDCGDMSDERQCDVECYTDQKGRDYRGYEDQTQYGTTCQKWTSQSPHSHEVTPSNHPGKGLGEHNYCRNPFNNTREPWCYTTDPNMRWQYCTVGKPSTLCNSVDIPKYCGGKLTASTGTFTTPRVNTTSFYYPHSSRCTWIIQAPNDRVAIHINFIRFNLQRTQNGKCKDWLAINNAKNNPSTTRNEGIYCGHIMPPSSKLNGNYFWLQFTSDDAVTSTGFVAKYQMISSTTAQTSTTVPSISTFSIPPGTITGKTTTSQHASSSSSDVMTTRINEENSTYPVNNGSKNGNIASHNSGFVFWASVGVASLLILLSILACILYLKSRTNRRTESTSKPTVRSTTGLTLDRQRDAATGDRGQSETGNTTHTNNSFQPRKTPSADTGIYQEIGDATQERLYVTVEPDSKDIKDQIGTDASLELQLHANDVCQPIDTPSTDTGFYHEIGDEKQTRLYVTVQPDSSKVKGQVDDATQPGRIHSYKRQDEEGWVENEIYTST